MKKLSVLLAVCLFLLSTTVKTWALGIEVAGGWFHQAPDGDISYEGGDTLSLKDVLNFDSQNKYMLRADIDLPLINFKVIYTPVKFEGSNTWTKNFTFGGKTFTAGNSFNSYLEMNQLDLTVYWGIPLLKTVTKVATLGLSGIDIQFGINVKQIKFDAKIYNSTVSAEAKPTLYIPMLYGGLNIDIWNFSLIGEVRGISYQSNHYYDILGLVKLRIFSLPLPFSSSGIFIDGGYRYQDIKLDTHDIKGSLKISGPVAEIGAEVKF
ncbi:MAG: TIGR04219 family outer membrane beta-barrel protein [Thermodesulfobacteria bacterium]|nr:TIGR04219 family outer membrane beta-barrel protein [Thermodesulfobacteriota bacterium]